MKKQHYLVLDSFRGICACIVAFSHLNANSIIFRSPLLDMGGRYVDFFFVLSGFVIFANYEEKLRNGYSIGKFILLRLGRLYPLHFFVLMAFLLVEFMQLFIHIDQVALYEPFSGPGESVKAIIAHIFLVHSLNILDEGVFNGPSWSISVEFYTYILFAFILAYSGKYSKKVIIAIALLSPIVLFLIHGKLSARLDFGIIRCAFGFACGALTWGLYKTWHQRLHSLTQRKLLINTLEIILFSSTVFYIRFFSTDTLSLLAPFIFGVLVLVFAFEGGVISRILKFKPFLLLGMLSYSIYMIHAFIAGKIDVAIRLMETRLNWEIVVEREGIRAYGANLISGTLLEIFYLFIVIAFSFLSYKLIEEPCRNKMKKLVAGKKKTLHP
jgi:peptidoglycan/LPS O-acetylase OafA/YrhL